ncbi:Olfactory Receptor 5B3 [Manis pentadactyla]|nr:Olfactory Receptor 5B3 [Manis pentadactyla]
MGAWRRESDGVDMIILNKSDEGDGGEHYREGNLQCGSSALSIGRMMSLSCFDRQASELILVVVASFNILFALLVILISYLFIFITILKMPSMEGYLKAFSTCASHLTTISIFYGTVIFMYAQPSSSHSMDTDKITSVFYAMIIPMLNPMVYSLRNKVVKSAFTKVVKKAKQSLGCTS